MCVCIILPKTVVTTAFCRFPSKKAPTSRDLSFNVSLPLVAFLFMVKIFCIDHQHSSVMNSKRSRESALVAQCDTANYSFF